MTTVAQYMERRSDYADGILAIPDKLWNFGYYVQWADRIESPLESRPLTQSLLDHFAVYDPACGAVGCALGHAGKIAQAKITVSSGNSIFIDGQRPARWAEMYFGMSDDQVQGCFFVYDLEHIANEIEEIDPLLLADLPPLREQTQANIAARIRYTIANPMDHCVGNIVLAGLR